MIKYIGSKRALLGHVTGAVAGVLPQGYGSLPNSVLRELMRLLAPLRVDG